MRNRLIAVGMAVLGVLASSCARASAQDFYKGRTLTILVGFPPGGGYDINARLLSRHIGRHIPGNPAVIVQNMAGAASMTAVNYLNTSAPKDGTVIDTFTFAQIGASRVRPDRIKADFRKFNWIGSTGEDPPFCYVWHTLGVNTLDQVKSHGRIHMGMTAAGALDDIGERILKSIFGVDVQEVAGYPGSAATGLAMERGEIDGGCGDWGTIPPDWIETHKIIPILNLASIRPPGMSESVPFAAALAKSGHDRSILRVLTGSAEVGRPFIASLAVPADRIEILRQAFDATMKDPEYLADAKRSHMPVTPKRGEAAAKLVSEIYLTPQQDVDAARKIMDE